MKRIAFLSAFFVMLSVMAVAQDSKMWVGGSVIFTNVNDDGGKETGFTIMPEFGYAINQNFTVGGALGYSTEIINIDGDKDTDNVLSIVPFARYSVINLDKISIFAQGELPLRFYSGKNFDGSSKDSQNSIEIALRPGLIYSFNEHWGFNMLMPSVFSFLTHSDNLSIVNFGINSGYTIQTYLLSTSIGFIYKF